MAEEIILHPQRRRSPRPPPALASLVVGPAILHDLIYIVRFDWLYRPSFRCLQRQRYSSDQNRRFADYCSIRRMNAVGGARRFQLSGTLSLTAAHHTHQRGCSADPFGMVKQASSCSSWWRSENVTSYARDASATCVVFPAKCCGGGGGPYCYSRWATSAARYTSRSRAVWRLGKIYRLISTVHTSSTIQLAV